MTKLLNKILENQKYTVLHEKQHLPSLKDVCIVITKNPTYYQNIYRYGALVTHVPEPCQKGHIVDAPASAKYHFYSFESLQMACKKCYPSIVKRYEHGNL